MPKIALTCINYCELIYHMPTIITNCQINAISYLKMADGSHLGFSTALVKKVSQCTQCSHDVTRLPACDSVTAS